MRTGRRFLHGRLAGHVPRVDRLPPFAIAHVCAPPLFCRKVLDLRLRVDDLHDRMRERPDRGPLLADLGPDIVLDAPERGVHEPCEQSPDGCQAHVAPAPIGWPLSDPHVVPADEPLHRRRYGGPWTRDRVGEGAHRRRFLLRQRHQDHAAEEVDPTVAVVVPKCHRQRTVRRLHEGQRSGRQGLRPLRRQGSSADGGNVGTKPRFAALLHDRSPGGGGRLLGLRSDEFVGSGLPRSKQVGPRTGRHHPRRHFTRAYGRRIGHCTLGGGPPETAVPSRVWARPPWIGPSRRSPKCPVGG